MSDLFSDAAAARLSDVAPLALRLRPATLEEFVGQEQALGEDTIGTQGTPVQVLGKLIAQRQIPKLWDVRSRLVKLFDAERKGSAA